MAKGQAKRVRAKCPACKREYRLPKGMSQRRTGVKCLNCGEMLAWVEPIPPTKWDRDPLWWSRVKTSGVGKNKPTRKPPAPTKPPAEVKPSATHDVSNLDRWRELVKKRKTSGDGGSVGET